MIKRQRPIGLKIAITLRLFEESVKIIQFLGFIAILFGHNANANYWLQKIGLSELEPLLQNAHEALNVLLFIIPLVIIIRLVIINELYNLKRWAWVIELILNGNALFSGLSVLIHGDVSHPIEVFLNTIGIIISTTIIYCLMIPSTRQALRKSVKAN